MYNRRESSTGKGGVFLENILNYLDDLFSHFPWNRKSSQIKSQLKDAMYADYQDLLDRKVKPETAFEMVKEKITEPEELAKYIPNSVFDFHTLLLCLNIIVFGIIYYFTNNPNFLQIFLPVRLEYPTIVARLIQLTVLCPLMGLVVYHFYKFLPQKYLSRTYLQSCICVFLGTILYALYFASSIAFIWYTLSGYNPTTLEHQPITALMYFIYKHIILKPVWMWIYSLIIGTLFMSSKQLYYCPRKVNHFELSMIYHSQFVSKSFDDEMTVPLPSKKVKKSLSWQENLLNFGHQTSHAFKIFFTKLSKKLYHGIQLLSTNLKAKKERLAERKVKDDTSKVVEIVEKEPFQKETVKQAVSPNGVKVNKPRTKNHANRKRPQMINAKKQKITLKTYGPQKPKS